MIELCVGNANLEYEDQYVGNDKNAKKLANQLGRQKCKAYRLN